MPPQKTEGFHDLYEREFSSIALVAGATAGSWAVGEEVAQEAFVRAHQRWGDVAQMDRPGAWVRRVAINLAIDRRRRAKREERALGRLDLTATTNQPEPNGHIWEAVGSLPPAQRAVVVMHYHDGYSTSEIAEVLGGSVTSVTSNLHKARKRLATQLGDRS